MNYYCLGTVKINLAVKSDLGVASLNVELVHQLVSRVTDRRFLPMDFESRTLCHFLFQVTLSS